MDTRSKHSTTLTIYRALKQSITFSPYLSIMHSRKLRNAIAKLRLSSHNLCIETGCHRNIVQENRTCVFCNLNDLEDEYHFTLICPVYINIRKQYIQKYFYDKLSVHKYITLLNSTTLYVIKSFKLRDSPVNQID